MRLSPCVVLCAALLAGGCVRQAAPGQDKDTSADRPAKSGELADSPPVSPRNAPGPDRPRAAVTEGQDVCALLSPKEIEEIAGVPIERAEKKPDGCDWYANAAAQQKKGADSARGTLGNLMNEEPKSPQDAMRSMENLLKGVGGAVAPDTPLFAVLVQRDHADAAEALLKTTVAVNGGTAAGGGLEPVKGLGDRAFIGAMGAIFYVRKGGTLITFGSMASREHAIALARRIVPRIQ